MDALPTFRPLTPVDLPTLWHWLTHPHVCQWWGAPPPSRAEVETEYLPMTRSDATTRGIDQFLANAEDLGKGLGSAMGSRVAHVALPKRLSPKHHCLSLSVTLIYNWKVGLLSELIYHR